MKKLLRVCGIVLILGVFAVPLDALPPGQCYGSQCAMCTITYYSNGDSTLTCGLGDSWGGCRCVISVNEGCWAEGTCYYHP
jgi:hypothetical protein